MPSINQTVRKVYSFSKLPEGWHYGDGGPINLSLIRRVQAFLSTAEGLGFEEANAFPGVDDEIQLTLYDGDTTFAFLFDSDSRISITEESRCEIISDVYGLSYLEAEQKLWELYLKGQIISGLSTYSIGTREIRSLETLLSVDPPKRLIPIEEYQSSAQSVYRILDEQYVSTPSTSIVLSLAIPQYSSA